MFIFNWLFSQGATVIVPVVVILLGLIFRVPMKRTLPSALKIGVGFTALFAIIGVALGSMIEAGNFIAERFGTGLTVTDVGWPVVSSMVFSTAYTLPIIAGLILANAVLVSVGFVKTLNVDVFNQWQYVFAMMLVYLSTGSWVVAGVVLVIMWLLSLKLGDWSAPFIQTYYDMPGVSIPHFPTVVWAPICFFMDKVWDRVPVIKDIHWDPENMEDRLGIFGEPVFIGFFVGLIFGGLSFFGNAAIGDFGAQLSKVISLSLTLAFFVVLLPRAAEMIVAGLVPLSQGIQTVIAKRMPGRKFYIGLDVAVLVGRVEHIALGAILVPLVYVAALLMPGNRVLPLADAAGFMIFFSVFAINTNKGNLFRGILNCMLVLFPFTFFVANKMITRIASLSTSIGFAMPAEEVSSLSPASNPFIYVFDELGRAISGNGGNILAAVIVVAVYAAIFWSVKNVPAEFQAEYGDEPTVEKVS